MIRVVVADDQALLRASLKLLVDHTPGLTCVGEAGTGVEAVAIARREVPDVVLMDVRMPEMNGIEATRLICRGAQSTVPRVLILTTFDLDEYVLAGLRAGASGFLVKEALPEELIRGIRLVASGESLLAPRATRQLIAAYTATPEHRPPASLPDLTAREREVLTLVGRGHSNDQIADELHLSMGTVKTHVGRLLAKLGARDRVHLVITAYENGLVTTYSGTGPR